MAIKCLIMNKVLGQRLGQNRHSMNVCYYYFYFYYYHYDDSSKAPLPTPPPPPPLKTPRIINTWSLNTHPLASSELLLNRNCAAHPEGPRSSSQGSRVPRLCLRSPISVITRQPFIRRNQSTPRKRRCPLEDTLWKLLGSRSGGRPDGAGSRGGGGVDAESFSGPPTARTIHFLSTSPFATSAFSPEAEVRAPRPEHQQSLQTNQESASDGEDPLPISSF